MGGKSCFLFFFFFCPNIFFLFIGFLVSLVLLFQYVVVEQENIIPSHSIAVDCLICLKTILLWLLSVRITTNAIRIDCTQSSPTTTTSFCYC